ncbi:MAG: hypothetical protein ACJA0B_001403 [Alcanivorax borkumensis]|jgi:hypothetical protein
MSPVEHVLAVQEEILVALSLRRLASNGRLNSNLA